MDPSATIQDPLASQFDGNGYGCRVLELFLGFYIGIPGIPMCPNRLPQYPHNGNNSHH